MLGVLLNQLLIFIIGNYSTFNYLRPSNKINYYPGGLGNCLTLVAIPYVKHKYGSEFSLLQLSSVVLILHLSVADLLYAVLGLPNFLLVPPQYWKIKTKKLVQVYLLRDGVIEEGSCYYPSLLRHLGNTLSLSCVIIVNIIATSCLCRLQHNRNDSLLCC